MPGIEKLLLEDALEDSPQTRCFLSVFEKDASALTTYTGALRSCCQRVLNAQIELSAATRGLSSHLKAYDSQKFPLENDDSTLSAMLRQFTVYLDELSSIQQIAATQLGDGMMYPVNKFMQADLEEIHQMSQMFQLVSHEHEQSLSRYMKVNKKKDSVQTKSDINNDLYAMRKKFHQTALHYFSSLNTLQYKRRISLLEPLVGFMHAQKAMHSLALETTTCSEVDDFLANVHASIQGVQQDLSLDTLATVEKVEAIEQQSAHLYYADLPHDLPYIPPNLTLTQKAGYLFMRSKQALIATKWERSYFFIQGGNLMYQGKDELAGSLVLDLNRDGVTATPVEIDDRRFCFQVNLAKRRVVLQAEDDRQKEEWISTINNVVKDSSFCKEKVKKRDSNSPNRPDNVRLGKSHEHQRKPTIGASGPANTMARMSLDASNFVPDAPIQFDMISPSDDLRPQSDVPQQRINPFDQSSTEMVKDSVVDGAAFSRSFIVRFLGSMEVQKDRGEQLILETIRQIMAARAIHNVFKTTESRLVVSSEAMRLIDPSNNSIKTEFSLEDISFWAAHNENKRLFGFITRTRPSTIEEDSAPTFACHIFECNTSADEICHAIKAATQLAFQAMMVKVAAGGDGEAVKTADAGGSSPESTELNPPITQMRGDGDERRVEGAECTPHT